jgi:hypothetical protein
MQRTNRGGARPGAGRHKTGRDIPVCFKITKEAYNILAQIKNKSEYINRIVLLNGVPDADKNPEGTGNGI